MDIHFSVTPDRILQSKKYIEEAPLVVLDGNFTQETIGMKSDICNSKLRGSHPNLQKMIQFYWKEKGKKSNVFWDGIQWLPLESLQVLFYEAKLSFSD